MPATASTTPLTLIAQIEAQQAALYGYISEAGHCRTRGARFRDRERKLMRHNSEKYELLPGVDMYDPINNVLLDRWVPGS